MLNTGVADALETRVAVEADVSEVREGIAAIRPMVAGDAKAELEFGHTLAAFTAFETAYAALSAAVEAGSDPAAVTELLDEAIAAADLVAVETDMLKDMFAEEMSLIAARTDRAIYLSLGVLAVLGAASVAVAALTSRRIAK